MSISMSPAVRKAAVAVAGVAALAVSATACSSTSAPAAGDAAPQHAVKAAAKSKAPGGSVVAKSAGQSSTAGSASGRPAGPAAPAADTQASTQVVAPCSVTTLAARVAADQGAAGTERLDIAVTNTGSAACTLDGYPTVQLADKAGVQQVTNEHGASVAFPAVTAKQVTLGAGGAASFSLAIGHVPDGANGTCVDASRLLITVPGADGALTVTQPVMVCNSTVTVSPFVDGTAGVA